MSSAPARSTHCDHIALFYRDQRDYVATLLRFLAGGIAAGEPAMVSVPGRNLNALRTALGRDADAIEMHDMTEAGRNPGRIIGDVLLRFAVDHSPKPVRIIGEPIWAGRDETEYPACAQHEALINPALHGRPIMIVCPYHLGELDPVVIADAKRTHPLLWIDGAQLVSDDYVDPIETAETFNQPLPLAPASAVRMSIYRSNSHATRRFTASFALAVDLPVDRVADAVLVVDELVSNTINHGGGRGRLSAWLADGRAVYEVSDAGHITDPLAGRYPVHSEESGRGLALVQSQSDLVRVHTSPRGTTTRAFFRLDGS
ncbi:MAG TPA: anti-sigma factor RsbA family regulatory protein [Micromonosporaceae bacterium]|jgi:anti-sigma regulatory factor (Ser/Thr protein kinase)